jgi:hypothetical protein
VTAAELPSPLRGDIQRITDVFTGADGGVCFVALCAFLSRMAAEGSPASRQVVQVVERFARMLRMVEEGRV